MQEVNHLKNAHYEAMRNIGYSDDEIEKDWVAFCKEYEELIDMTKIGKEYRPFGSSATVALVKDEAPW